MDAKKMYSKKTGYIVAGTVIVAGLIYGAAYMYEKKKKEKAAAANTTPAPTPTPTPTPAAGCNVDADCPTNKKCGDAGSCVDIPMA
jgi:hypothetical protein